MQAMAGSAPTVAPKVQGRDYLYTADEIHYQWMPKGWETPPTSEEDVCDEKGRIKIDQATGRGLRQKKPPKAECLICSSKYPDNMTSLDCHPQHTVHVHCLTLFLKKKKIPCKPELMDCCPMCRAKVSDNIIKVCSVLYDNVPAMKRAVRKGEEEALFQYEKGLSGRRQMGRLSSSDFLRLDETSLEFQFHQIQREVLEQAQRAGTLGQRNNSRGRRHLLQKYLHFIKGKQTK